MFLPQVQQELHTLTHFWRIPRKATKDTTAHSIPGKNSQELIFYVWERNTRHIS